ncbi:MAG TPA: EAL domain-containing protein [Dehalococcoidia bacterium]
MASLSSLDTLARLARSDDAPEDAVSAALPLLREELGGDEAFIVYGVANDFHYFGEQQDLELSRTALWIINRELNGGAAPLGFRARYGRVRDFRPLSSRAPRDYVAALIPAGPIPAHMLIVRGSWPRGVGVTQRRFLNAAMPSVGMLLERRLRIGAAEDEHAQLGTIVSVARVIGETQDLESMLTSIAKTVATLSKIDYVSIDILGSDGALRLRCVNYRQADESDGADDRWKRAAQRRDPVRDLVVASRKALMFADAQNDERIPDPARNFFMRTLIRSAGLFPLVVQDDVLGVLSVAAVRRMRFDAAEVDMLEGLAAQVAMAVKAVQLYEERRLAEDALQRSEDLLRATLESTADGILVVDADGHAAYLNSRFAEMWRIPSELIASREDERLLQYVTDQLVDPGAFVAKVRELYESSSESLDTIDFNDGRVFERYSRPMLEGAGAGGRVWSFRDITSERQAASALRQSEERFRSLVQNASDLITVVEPDTTIVYQSPASERVLGYRADELTGRKLSSFVHEDDLARMVAFLREAMSAGTATTSLEARLCHRNGTWVYVEIVGSDQRRDLAVRGLVMNIRDVSERKKLEEQLRFQAFHDPLTGLANRARFADRLEHSLVRGRRDGRQAAVLFMDLDDFKSINDGLGHAAGDHLLIEVTRRVQTSLRGSDTAARFGGDEFAILLESIDDVEQATQVADRIFDTLREPFEIEGKEIFVRASIGIALSGDGAPSEEILRNADVAMYAAKGHGKGRYDIYEPGMHVAMLARLELLADLDRAIERQEFVLHYQPMVTLDEGQIVGVEALVRWQHPKHGIIAPADFIPLAEESGAILPLGRWVMDEACHQVSAWQERYQRDPAWTLSVNVSVKQVQQAGFTDEVAAILASCSLAPQSLIIEITESVMMQEVELMLERLHELKRLGVRLAIDDFGTGYSSLSYLRQFPFDILKIDKSFVDGADDAISERDLTRAIIELGKTFQLDIVAEGIERVEQLARLQSLDCGLGQGYYFARPLEREAVDALLGESLAREAAA